MIRDPDVHRRVLEEVLTFAQENGFNVRGLIRSPVLGPKGNVEFLAWLTTTEAHDDCTPVRDDQRIVSGLRLPRRQIILLTASTFRCTGKLKGFSRFQSH